MIAADVGIIDEAGHSGEQGGDGSEQHRVERIAHEIRHGRKQKTAEVEQKAEQKKPDRKMDQHRMERVLERLAFEKIFHVDLTPVEDWHLRLERFHAIDLSTSGRR